MKSFFTDIFHRNKSLLLTAAVLFLSGYFLNLYFNSEASVEVLHRSVQSFLQERERDFEELARDTGFLHRLYNKQYNETELERVTRKEYGIFLYTTDTAGRADTLKFWNDQRSFPSYSLVNGPDGYSFIPLTNGQYDCIRKTLTDAYGTRMVVVALIPVRWQYYISTTNLTPEFTDRPAAEERLMIAAGPTDMPVKNSLGSTLFYLQKKPGYHAPAHHFIIPLAILLGLLLILILIHNVAHTIRGKWGAAWGIGFLIAVILLLRILVYGSPDILNLRQFELFDPTIYSSSIILNSLGDLVINAFLFCWIIVFIKRELSEYTIPQSEQKWKNWVWIILGISLLVVTTFEFANIVQSLVTDAKISFNVTNFFSLLKNYSFVGFVALAALALGYFFLSQVLFQLIGYLIRSLTIVLYIIIATIGLLLLTFIHNTHNTDAVELDIYVLLWLLAYVWLMQRRVFSDLRFRLNVSEVLFWLFIFSSSISAVILFENRKIEEEKRRAALERLAEQADPTSEKMVNIVFSYIDNDFLSLNFARFKDPASNIAMKDSMVNRNFSPYQSKFDTRLYTFDGEEKPLFNEPPISYDTLNTTFILRGKNTGITDLKYVESSFDKYTYIYKKTLRNDSLGKMAGYLFILSEPKSYKGNDALVPELFRVRNDNLPEYYAIYNKRELVSDNNDYPFSTHLADDQIPKTDFAHVRKGAYDELWHRIAEDSFVVVVKRDNSAIEDITLFAYLFSAFLFMVALFRVAALLIWSRLHWSQLKTYWQMNIRSQIHTTIIFISLFSFVVIGVATIFFFINRYNRNNQDRLSRAMQILVSEVQSKLAAQLAYGDLQKMINQVAQVHGTDINIYDLGGNLKVSSNQFVYDKGILSKKMHPLAWYNLH
ncbi:MAG TPA: hypothetical protein VNU72_10500, partial [Puia sp.]|nr:hypothetical protein [Puia sp.]